MLWGCWRSGRLAHATINIITTDFTTGSVHVGGAAGGAVCWRMQLVVSRRCVRCYFGEKHAVYSKQLWLLLRHCHHHTGILLYKSMRFTSTKVLALCHFCMHTHIHICTGDASGGRRSLEPLTAIYIYTHIWYISMNICIYIYIL